MCGGVFCTHTRIGKDSRSRPSEHEKKFVKKNKENNNKNVTHRLNFLVNISI